MDDASQYVATPDRTVTALRGWMNRRLKIDALMWPSCVVVVRVFGQNGAQMALVNDEQFVQTLGSRGSNPALRMCIRIGCLQGRQDNFTAFGFEDLVERLGEFRISITDQLAECHGGAGFP